MQKEDSDLSQAIESGEYYQRVMHWYNDIYHAPIQERALLLIVTGMACFTTFMALFALFMLLPVETQTPVVVPVEGSLDKIVRAEPLMAHPDDDVNEAVLQWLMKNYVAVREGYDITRQESFHRRVRAISAAPVYAQYVAIYRSSESPTVRYERHTQRKIEVSRIELHGEDRAEVVFIATEESSKEDRKTQWKADITFRFEEIKVDQVSGEVTPMKFEVTGYESKQIG